MAKTIVCFGDSNTHGYNSQNMGRFTEKERWTCLLAEMLGEEYLVREEGMGGRTTVFDDPLFEGLCGLDYIYPCMMTHEPVSLLIVMLGTNDVKERFAVNPENIAKGMEHLLTKAMRSLEAWENQRPNVLLIAPPPIEKGYETTFIYGEMGDHCVEKSQKLAAVYKEVANRLGCHFLDAGAIEGVSMYPYDYMHLSLDGHRCLAEELARVIPEII